jgi:tetratricopeptide (TPR) repeat protein
VGGPFGSPAYLAAVAVMLIPASVGLACDPAERRSWRLAAGAAAGSGLLALGLSGTKAGLVGMGAALLVSLPAWWRSAAAHPVRAGLAAMAVIALTLVSPVGGRMADLAGEGGQAAGRLDEWRIGMTALARRPLAGTGLEGYRIAFPGVVDAAYTRAYGREVVTDRAHSGPIDLGISLGLPGAVAWLAAAGFLGVRGWRASRMGPLLAGLGAGVAGYFAQQLFLFPIVEGDVVLWALAGVLVAGVGPRREQPVVSKPLSWLAAALSVAALLAGALDVMADRQAASALAADRVEPADRAAALRPDSFRYRLVGAEVARRSGSLEQAMARIGEALALSPNDPALRSARARLLVEAAQAGGAAEIEAAVAALRDLVTTDPNHGGHRLALGAMLAAQGAAAEAEQELLTAEFLAPGDPAPAIALARLYLAAGEEEAARQAVERAAAIDPDADGLQELRRLLAG